MKLEAFKRNKVFFGGILEFRKHSKKTLRESTIDCFWCVEHFTCRLLPKTTPICSSLQERSNSSWFWQNCCSDQNSSDRLRNADLRIFGKPGFPK